MRYGAPGLVALLVTAAAFGRPPAVVPWSEASAHVGKVITVEGTVASARVEGGACILDFAPEDPQAFRVVLMLPLFSAPAAPERLYAGYRVHASGRVQTFQGRPEMIIRRADQIEVMDLSSTTSTPLPTTTSTLPPPPLPPVAPAPTVTPSTVPDAGAGRPAVSARCARARDRLDAARRELTDRSEDAARCLRMGTSRCETERAAVARALETLPAREAEADSACR